MTTREEIRVILAGIDGRLAESRRSRRREFQLACEALVAVARHRYPSAASLNYANYGDGDRRDETSAIDIRDGADTVLWTRDPDVEWEDRDKFTVLIQTYADDLKLGTEDDVFIGGSNAGEAYPTLVFPPTTVAL